MKEEIRLFIEEVKKERTPEPSDIMEAIDRKIAAIEAGLSEDDEKKNANSKDVLSPAEEMIIGRILDLAKSYDIKISSNLGLLNYVRARLNHVDKQNDGDIGVRKAQYHREDGLYDCTLKFLYDYESFPQDVQAEIIKCIRRLQVSRYLDIDSKKIINNVLEDLVNHTWDSSDALFVKSAKEIMREIEAVIGHSNLKKKLLRYYNSLKLIHNEGPFVLYIKGKIDSQVDEIIKTFAAAVGRYREISCQNIGRDPECVAGSSRIYCNSNPGDFAEAIIRNNAKTIILRNINDTDKRAVGQISSFFENTFVDNFYHLQVPGNVIVICTDSLSGNEVPEFLMKDAHVIELESYSNDEMTSIVDEYIYID